MIKVLNKDVEQTFYKQECEKCHAELEFAFDDTYEGAYGARYLKCPVCGEELWTEIDGVELTSDNIKFPIHFYHMGKNAVDIEDDKIQEWVREGLETIEDGNVEDFYLCMTGNAAMIILEMEDEYCIYVMKNYWECDIPKKNMNEV